MLRYQ